MLDYIFKHYMGQNTLSVSRLRPSGQYLASVPIPIKGMFDFEI